MWNIYILGGWETGGKGKGSGEREGGFGYIFEEKMKTFFLNYKYDLIYFKRAKMSQHIVLTCNVLQKTNAHDTCIVQARYCMIVHLYL